MNQRPLTSAHNPDLPASFEALKRAAQRARELARKTGTALVISDNGHIRLVEPPAPTEEVHEERPPYGEQK